MNSRVTVLTITALLLLAGCDNNTPGKVPTNKPVADAVTATAAGSVPADSEHNARNSLDWAGTYEGMLPCADCEGISTTVVLSADGGYQLSQVYIGKSAQEFNSSGKFNWNEAGNTVLLEAEQPVQFFVGENQLSMLDQQGKRIEGELAARYNLKKQQDKPAAP
ncbi:copper resistance protein NlpE [Rheinheimera sp. NSM]|uniref:copper resistance protein NlpE n=1 Tax=Rheinheimera sp. NSM TaxID=3457884 RepID=UPI004036D256